MKKNSLILNNFHSFQLSKPLSQEKSLKTIAWLMAASQCVKDRICSKQVADILKSQIENKVAKYGVSPKVISQRSLKILDKYNYEKINPNQCLPDLFEDIKESPEGARLDLRMKYYQENVNKAFCHWYDNNDYPKNLVHVTCSGYLSPSVPQVFASKIKEQDVCITHSYHMGCYGAFPGVRIGTGLLLNSMNGINPQISRSVDIVHTELLSIHFNPVNITPSNIVNMSLFADGFIKYSISITEEGEKNNYRGLKILAAHEILIPDSLEDMSWIPGPFYFDMYLSRNVPLSIKNHIKQFVKMLWLKAGLDLKKEKKQVLYAIHPGGSKIINFIADELNLSFDQVFISKKILFLNGNMSSATVPYIWKEICESKEISIGTKIITFAFGPGLTATGFVLEKI